MFVKKNKRIKITVGHFTELADNFYRVKIYQYCFFDKKGKVCLYDGIFPSIPDELLRFHIYKWGINEKEHVFEIYIKGACKRCGG